MINKDENLLFDKRIVERNIKSGKITKDDLICFIQKLPDLHNKYDDITEIIFVDKKLKEERCDNG